MRTRHVLSLVVSLAVTTQVFAAVEEAKQADAFVDSLGINTHFTNSPFKESPYSKPALDQKLAALGIRHIRDNTETPQGFVRVDGLHSRFGITAILVPNGTTKPISVLVGWLKQHPAYDAIEGLNEPDFHTRSFEGLTDAPKAMPPDYRATRAFQEALYSAFKADASTKAKPVLSPAMAHVIDQHFLDGVSFDIGSMHSYPPGGEPKLAFGKRLDQMMEMKGADGQPRPIWITETGFFNRTHTGGEVSELAAGKYLPRLFALSFKAGIARTYTYELVDQGTDPNNREHNFGLLRNDLSEKPAYISTKNLTTLLKEPPSAKKGFNRGSLDLEITSNDSNAQIEHLLLQKTDGRCYLLVWNDVPSWDRRALKDLTVAPVPVQIKFAKPIAAAKVYRISASPMKPELTKAGTTIDLPILDEISVIEIVLAP